MHQSDQTDLLSLSVMKALIKYSTWNNVRNRKNSWLKLQNIENPKTAMNRKGRWDVTPGGQLAAFTDLRLKLNIRAVTVFMVHI